MFFVLVSLLSWMPRLTNSLASCSGTDLSLSQLTSDVISSGVTRATV